MDSIWLRKSNQFLLYWLLPLGMIVFLSGKIFLPGSGSHITQTYIWLMFPCLLFCLFAGRNAFRGYKPTALEGVILAFLFLNTVSYFWSSTDEAFDRFYKDMLYNLLFLFAITSLLRSSKNNLVRVMEVAGFIIVIGAIISIYYHYVVLEAPFIHRAFRLYTMGPWEQGHFSNPIPAGLFYGPFALFFFVRLLESRGQRLQQCLFLLALLVLLTYVLLTGSRGPTYSLFAGFFVLWSFRRDRPSTALCLVIATVTLVIFVQNGMIKPSVLATEPVRMNTPVAQVDYLASGVSFNDLPTLSELEETLNIKFNERGTIWFGSVREIGKAPWFGHGIDAEFAIPYFNDSAVASHPHSLYLRILYDTGLTGFILFALMILLTLRECWPHRDNPIIQLSVAMMVFGLLGCVTDVHRIFHKPNYYWMLVWFPVGLTIGVRLKETLGNIQFMPDHSERREVITIRIKDKPVSPISVKETEI